MSSHPHPEIKESNKITELVYAIYSFMGKKMKNCCG